MISASRCVVHLAVWVTPAGRRDRFREEWLANLRDAPNLGLSRSAIARGALRFALSPTGQRATAEEIARYNPRASIALTLLVGLIVAGALVLVSPFMILTIGLAPLALGTSTIVASSQLTKGRKNKLPVAIASTLTGMTLAAEVAAFWLWGVAFDLADANRPTGALDAYISLSILVGATALLGLIATAIALRLRSRRYPRAF